MTPNHSPRRPGARVRWVVWHCDASPSESATLAWIANPESKVSYHWLIRRNGEAVRLVPDTRAAWACGQSQWDGVNGLNSWSVSIAFANRNNRNEPLTDAQLATAQRLWGEYKVRFPGIVPLTHTMVATPTGRKNDPEAAPNFRLAEFG